MIWAVQVGEYGTACVVGRTPLLLPLFYHLGTEFTKIRFMVRASDCLPPLALRCVASSIFFCPLPGDRERL